MRIRRKAFTLLILILMCFLIGYWIDRSAQRTIEDLAMKTLEVYIQRYWGRMELSQEETAQIDHDSRMHGYYLHMRTDDRVIYSNATDLVRETPSSGEGISIYRSKHLQSRTLLIRSELGRGSMRLYLPIKPDWPISLWLPAASGLILLFSIWQYHEESCVRREWETVSLRVKNGEPLKDWEEAPAHADSLLSAMDRRFQQDRELLVQMRDDRSEMEAILRSVETGVVALDEEYRVLFINPAAADMFHIEEEEAIGKDALLLLRSNEFDDVIEEYKKGADLPDEPFQLRLGNRDLSVHLSPTIYTAHESGVTLAIEDTTKLNRLLSIRREFVSNVSHELRTPMTSIKGFTQTLLTMDVNSPQAKRFLRILESEVDRLEQLVADLEILSTIEKNEDQTPEGEIFSPSEALQEEKGSIETILLPHPDIKLRWDVAYSRRRAVGSSALFRQLAYNLCENAVKYSKPSGALLIVRLRETENFGILEIEDNGVGIPEKDIARIFERFYRVDRSRSSEIAGTGLGLAIVKHIAITLGGEIQVDSKLGIGSRFTFTFPLTDFTRS